MNTIKIIACQILIFTSFSCANTQEVEHIDSKLFSELSRSKPGIILDVRTSQEYSRGHIANSTLISTRDSKFVEKINLLQKDKPIYVYCLTGSRSRAVANYLVKNGFTKVYNLKQGVVEWNKYGYPLQQSDNIIASKSKVYSETEFKNIINSEPLALVNFHATWCAPCKKMAPIIAQIENEFANRASIVKIDVEVNKALKNELNIGSIPGFVLYKNGKEVWKHTGIIGLEELSQILKENITN